MAETRSLPDLKDEAVRLLREYRNATSEARTPILRSLAEVLVESRAHFDRPDGSPDWKGRSHPYRIFVRDVYAEANFPKDEQATIQAATRYHIGSVLRERLDEDTLREYDLAPATPREKSAERRQARSAFLNALSHRDFAGGSLLALSAGLTALSKVDANELSNLNDRDTGIVDEVLGEIEQRLRYLRNAVAHQEPQVEVEASVPFYREASPGSEDQEVWVYGEAPPGSVREFVTRIKRGDLPANMQIVERDGKDYLFIAEDDSETVVFETKGLTFSKDAGSVDTGPIKGRATSAATRRAE